MVIKKTTPHTSLSPNDEYRREKISEITGCLEKKEVNLWHLRELCLSRGGLINGDLRRRSWHKLTGINRTGLDLSDKSSTRPIEQASGGYSNSGVPTSDLELISRDVGRAVFFRYKFPNTNPPKIIDENPASSASTTPTEIEAAGSSSSITNNNNPRNRTLSSGTDYSIGSDQTGLDSLPIPALLTNTDKQSTLAKVIVTAISGSTSSSTTTKFGNEPPSNSRLHYYQGFHDVASVILANISNRPELAASILRKLAKSHLRDATREDFSGITCFLEIALYPLLQVLDEELHDYFIFRELGPTAFITWIITLFAHDIHDSDRAGRLFDALLASHPLMPLYFSVAILVNPGCRDRIFDTDEDDPAMLHVVVTGLTSCLVDDFEYVDVDSDSFTIQDMIDTSISLMKDVPPEHLLHLAMKYDLGQSETLLKRGHSISLFKAPPSWATASTAPPDWVQRKERRKASQNSSTSRKASSLNVRASVMGKSEMLGNTNSGNNNHDGKKTGTGTSSSKYPNAKIACGVSTFMAEAEDAKTRKKRSVDISRSTAFMAARNFMGFIKISLGIKKQSRRKRIGSCAY